MFYITDKMPNGSTFTYTFLMDFDIADAFGKEAVEDTYKRALKEWQNNIVAIAELYIAINMRNWFWYDNGNHELARLYEKLFYELRNFVYRDDTIYSEEQLNTFFKMTD